MKIGLFYGSDTGTTEEVANKIADKIGKELIDLNDIGSASDFDFEKYNHIILGTSTWYDGDLQSDWEYFFPSLDSIDFTGKTVAIFGLGDQHTYCDFFIDGVGIIYDKIIEKGATVVGQWPTDGYEHDESVAERDGVFMGLALDEDNESEKTEERIDTWLKQISKDFGF